MDVPALSIAHHQVKLVQQMSLAVMRMAMDRGNLQSRLMVESLARKPAKTEPGMAKHPNLGSILDRRM